MKDDRSSTTAIIVSPMVFALDVPGPGSHGLQTTEFAGCFVLPFEASWIGGTLPAGKYILYFGIQRRGIYFVEIVGRGPRSPHGIVLTEEHGIASAARNALICIRDGDSQTVYALEMPTIGKSVRFALPSGKRPIASKLSKRASSHLAERPISIPASPLAK